jgi:hypothetical protein
MRVAVSGGRDYRLSKDDWAFLNELHEAVIVEEGVEGGATGADAGFRDWCDENMIPVTTFRAAWRRPGRRVYDPGAGPKRNRRMGRYVALAPAVWVFFPGGSGTNDAYAAAVELRKTQPDLVIVDRRNVRGPQKLPEIRPRPAPRVGLLRVEREYSRPPGGFGHGADMGNDDRG